jgi:predicted amidohydrolase
MKPHAISDGFVSILKNASGEFSNTIVAGSTFLKENTARPTNTSLVFSNGKLIHRYDKIHLFKPGGDTKFFGRGLRSGTFRLPTSTTPLRAGVVICYDLRFPELMRTMALDGINILFVPARWPAVRDEAWQTLLKARAIENQIFVVGCNAQDAEGGYSYAFDPLGGLISSNRTQRKKLLHTIDLDLHRIDEATRLHDNLSEAVFLKKRLRMS